MLRLFSLKNVQLLYIDIALRATLPRTVNSALSPSMPITKYDASMMHCVFILLVPQKILLFHQTDTNFQF